MIVKVALLFPINFLNYFFLKKLAYINIIIKGSYKGIFVELERKHYTALIFLRWNWKSFMTDLLNIIVDDFGIRLLDYRI